VVCVHATTDSFGAWPEWDALHGTRFQNHPSSDRYATVRLDTLSGQDDSWTFLNRGLADTTFLEEWFSFTTNADVIRATPGLKTTLNIDETSYTGGMGGARAMGEDHPMSWYREFPEGGRFFYTALGHRANLYQGGSQPRFLRRQLYNAILWAAGHNGDGTSVRGEGRGTEVSGGRFADHARAAFSGGTLTVSLLRDGPHAVGILGLDGRRVAEQRGTGRQEYAFASLRPGVHIVSVTTGAGRAARLVTIP
jgi:type 1 glutamine amidotransferase